MHSIIRVRAVSALCLLTLALGSGCGDDSSPDGESPQAGTGDDGEGRAGAGGAPQAGGGAGMGGGGNGSGQPDGGPDPAGQGGAGQGGSGGAGGSDASTPSGVCGDGELDDGEECDDGNTDFGDGCSVVCAIEDGFVCEDEPGEPCASVCGDELVKGEEGCDDGNDVDDDWCPNDCSQQAKCGDGEHQPGADEECDDGNTEIESCEYGQQSCTVCNDRCREIDGATSYCGDGLTDDDNEEECDDGNAVTDSCDYGAQSCTVCDEHCTEAAGAVHSCGDGTTDAPDEQCDDHNTVTETCAYGQTSCTVCTATCQTAAGATSYCGDGDVDSSNNEDCDDDNAVTEVCAYGQQSCSVCGSACRMTAGNTSYCGDLRIDQANGEDCDDGDQDPNDGCDDCEVVAIPQCGNSTIEAGVDENCDDGNTISLDGCNAACQREAGWTCPQVGQDCVETCGDGMVVGDEACDDQDQVDTDYCSNDCRTRRFCGDGSTQGNEGEQCDDGNNTTESCAYGMQSCTVCSATCQNVAGATDYCGDTLVDAAFGEECDAGAATETCRSDCKLQKYCILEFALTGTYELTNTVGGFGDGEFPQTGGTTRVRLPDNGNGVPGAHPASLNRTGILYYNMPVTFSNTIALIGLTIDTEITSRAGTADNLCPLNRGTLEGTNAISAGCPYREMMGSGTSASGHCTTNWTPDHQNSPAIVPGPGCLPTMATGNIECTGSEFWCGQGNLDVGANPVNDSWFQPQNTGQFSADFTTTTMNGTGGPIDCPAGDPSRPGADYTDKLETPERATSRGWITTTGTRTSIMCGQLPAVCP